MKGLFKLSPYLFHSQLWQKISCIFHTMFKCHKMVSSYIAFDDLCGSFGRAWCLKRQHCGFNSHSGPVWRCIHTDVFWIRASAEWLKCKWLWFFLCAPIWQYILCYYTSVTSTSVYTTSTTYKDSRYGSINRLLPGSDLHVNELGHHRHPFWRIHVTNCIWTIPFSSSAGLRTICSILSC